MMEVLLQGFHECTKFCQNCVIIKNRCIKVLTEDSYSKFLNALLFIIGSKQSSSTECINSAKYVYFILCFYLPV